MAANTPSEPQPTSQPEMVKEPSPDFGWTQYAEQINGRFAMIGFIGLLVMELFTKQDFFTWIGLH